ncbi:MAG: hypothetical protein J5685_11825 [Clostridiales bacterium]|nr:hypothetical protein [Clostridiales bacterium]
MNVSKVFSIVQVVFMYGLQVFACLFTYGGLYKTLEFKIALTVFLIVAGVAFISGLVSTIAAGVSSLRGGVPCIRFFGIIKLILLPYYIINIFFWLKLIGGFMNPFLMLGIPILIIIGVCATYLYMVLTSLPAVISTAVYMKKQHRKISAIIVLALVAEFIFVLDTVGAVILMKCAGKDILTDGRT